MLNKTRIRTLLTQNTQIKTPTMNSTGNPHKHQTKYAQTEDMRKYNQSFWRRIGLVKPATTEGKWQCAIENCAHAQDAIPKMAKQLAVKHPQYSQKSKEQSQCPFCNKTYTALIPLLTHLNLTAKKTPMGPMPMPLHPQHITQTQTWQYLLHHNKPRNEQNPERNTDIPRENRTKQHRENKKPKNRGKSLLNMKHTKKTAKNTPTLLQKPQKTQYGKKYNMQKKQRRQMEMSNKKR